MPKLLIALIIFLIVLGGGFFLIWPNYQKWQQLNEVVAVKKTELEATREYYKSLEATARELDTYKDSLAKIQSALPSSPSISSMLNFIEKIASENGLILKSISRFTITSGQVKTINLPITLAGSYPSLKGFLSSLEKSARIIDAKLVSFKVPLAKDGSSLAEGGLPEFDLSIITHSY